MRSGPVRRSAALLAASAPGAGAGARGARRPQPPVFGVGVDVVAVDASVVDADGRPVLGPRPRGLPGRGGRQAPPPRLGRVRGPRPRAGRAAPARPGALQQQRGRAAGPAGAAARRPRQHRPGRRAARCSRPPSASSTRSPPADRVGLAFVPGPGPGIEFTAERRGRPAGPEGRGGHGGPRRVPGAAGRGRRPHPDERPHALAAVPRPAVRRVHAGEPGDRRDRPSDAVPAARSSSASWSWRRGRARSTWHYRERSLATQSALRATLRSLERIEGPKTRRPHLGGPRHGVARPRCATSAIAAVAGPGDAVRRPPRHLVGRRVVRLLGDRDPWRTGRSRRRGSTTSPRRRAGPCCAWSARGTPPSSGSRAS